MPAKLEDEWGAAAGCVSHLRSAELVVPVALCLYLEKRGARPERVLAALYQGEGACLRHTLSSYAHPHFGLRACELGALAIIWFQDGAVQALIAAEGWSVHAAVAKTTLTLASFPELLRASLVDSLLHEWVDVDFLPRTLRVEKISDEGQGVRIRGAADVQRISIEDRCDRHDGKS